MPIFKQQLLHVLLPRKNGFLNNHSAARTYLKAFQPKGFFY